MSSLLGKHDPVTTKFPNHKSKPNPWFTPSLSVFRSSVRQADNLWKRTHSALHWLSFNCLRNVHHNLIHISKQKTTPVLVSSSDNPRRLWQTVNNLLHRRSSSLLPSFTSCVFAGVFAFRLTVKTAKLRLSVVDHSTFVSPRFLFFRNRLLISPLFTCN